MERETGLEPATSSLGIQMYFESKPLARFCCEFLNLQRLAESAFSRLDRPNEAQMRHVLHTEIAGIAGSVSAASDGRRAGRYSDKRLLPGLDLKGIGQMIGDAK